MSIALGALAVRFGCELKGDPGITVDAVATLDHAGPTALTFLANPKYRRQLSVTRAAAVVLHPKFADASPVPALLSTNPYATYARIAQLLHPEPAFAPGVHASAVVHAQAFIAPGAHVGAGAVIGAGVRVGEGAVVGPGSVLLEGAQLGDHSRLTANVTLCRGVRVGARAILHPGVVIGADGFGFAPDFLPAAEGGGGWVKVPQLGGVLIGDDVEIGANTTIDRGTIEDTVIESGVKLDNQIQIGHNVRLGAHTVVAGCTGISGSTHIGQRCLIAGMVGIAGHISICDDVTVTGRTFVNNSIRTPGVYSGGLPMDEARRFRRNSARFRQLDELARRVAALEGAAPAESEDTNIGDEDSDE